MSNQMRKYTLRFQLWILLLLVISLSLFHNDILQVLSDIYLRNETVSDLFLDNYPIAWKFGVCKIAFKRSLLHSPTMPLFDKKNTIAKYEYNLKKIIILNYIKR